MSLYHGTTKTLADRIMAVGFRPFDPEDMLGSLAAQFDLDRALIQRQWAWGFVARRAEQRDPHVYFTDLFHLASRYARRGPEVRHQGLQAVWHAMNPDAVTRLGNAEARTRGEEWAKEHAARTEVPVVVDVVFPISLLPAERLEQLERCRLLRERGIDATPFRNFGWQAQAVDPAWIAGYTEVKPCTCWRDGRQCQACRNDG